MKLKHLLASTSLSLTLLTSSIVSGNPLEDKTSTSLPKSISAKFSNAAMSALVQKRHPGDFSGHHAINRNVVAAYRAGSSELRDVTHNSALLPVMDQLENHLKSNPHIKESSQFLEEIAYRKDMKTVTPEWAFLMHFRVAAASSKITKDEKNLFAHVPNAEFFFGFSKDNAWQTHNSAIKSLEDYDNKGHVFLPSSFFTHELPSDIANSVADSVQKYLPAHMYYPCLGEGKFGLGFMIPAILQDVFPIGFPSESLPGHGGMMSPLGFAAHDMVHAEMDHRQFMWTHHVLQQAEEHHIKGGSILDFMEIFPPIAGAQYKTVMGALNELASLMATKLIPHAGIHEFRKAMIGFFWALHENPHFLPNLFGTTDLEEVIEGMTDSEDKERSVETIVTEENKLVSYSSRTITDEEDFETEWTADWESSEDPLVTSPLTGESMFEDEQIYQFVLENMTKTGANAYKYSFSMPEVDDLSLNKDGIISYNVERSAHFINVTLNLKDGEKVVYTFPTLYHKWENMDDNLGLLRYGKTRIEKPDLAAVGVDAERRELAQETLDTVWEHIEGHVDHFKTMAWSLANQNFTGEGSLSERFFKRMHALNQLAQKKLDEKLPSVIFAKKVERMQREHQAVISRI